MLSGFLAAPHADAAEGCAAVRMKYPTGVALSARTAAGAYAESWRTPEVSRRVYLKHKYLDPEGTGAVCLVRPRSAAPPPAMDVTVTPMAAPADGSPTLMVTWKAGGRAWPLPVTYNVLLNGEAPPGDVVASFGAGNYSLQVSDLTPATRYTVSVSARNPAGVSSVERSVTTP